MGHGSAPGANRRRQHDRHARGEKPRAVQCRASAAARLIDARRWRDDRGRQGGTNAGEGAMDPGPAVTDGPPIHQEPLEMTSSEVHFWTARLDDLSGAQLSIAEGVLSSDERARAE